MGNILASVLKQYEEAVGIGLCKSLTKEEKEIEFQENLNQWELYDYLGTGTFYDDEIYNCIIKEYCSKLGIIAPIIPEIIKINEDDNLYIHSGEYTNGEYKHNFKFYVIKEAFCGNIRLLTNFCNSVIINIFENCIYQFKMIEYYKNVYSTTGEILTSFKDSDWHAFQQRDSEIDRLGCDIIYERELQSELEKEGDLQNFSSDSLDDIQHEMETAKQENASYELEYYKKYGNIDDFCINCPHKRWCHRDCDLKEEFFQTHFFEDGEWVEIDEEFDVPEMDSTPYL